MDPLKHAPLKIYDIRNKYKVIDKVGRGTYGTVFKVLSLEDNKYYAIKKFQNTQAKLQVEGFPITALREISLLKQLNHPNIINLKQIICSKPNKRNLFRGSTFLVFQYMHHDFSGLFRSKIKFSQPQIKSLMKQILQGCNYLHNNKIMHRDIKSANILLNDNGVVQLADFGLGRRTRFQSIFTYKVVTLWYRAPELLLGCKCYNHKVDVWSIGCVFAQFLIGDVLFKKQTQYAIIQKIYQICGDLDENQYTQDYLKGCVYYQDMKPKKSFKNNLFNYIKKLNPDVDNLSLSFLKGLLQLNPYKRLSCQQALSHQFFSQYPLPCEAEQIQKLDVQYHEMFRDRSLKIQRQKRIQNINWTDQEEQKKKQQNQIKSSQNYKKYNNHTTGDNDKNPRYERNYEKRHYNYSNRYYQRQNQFSKMSQTSSFNRREYRQNERRQHRDQYKRQQRQSGRRLVQERHRKKFSSKSDSISSSSSSSQSKSRSRSRSRKKRDYAQNQNQNYKSKNYYQRNYHQKNQKDKQKTLERQKHRHNNQGDYTRFNGRQYQRYDNERKIQKQIKPYNQQSAFHPREYRKQHRYERQQNTDRYRSRYQRFQRDQKQSFALNQKNYSQDKRRPYFYSKQKQQRLPYVQFKYRSEKYQNLESNKVSRDNYENRNYHSREYLPQSMKNQYGPSKSYQNVYKPREGNYENYRYKDHMSKDSRQISVQKRQSPSKKSMNFQQY